MCGLIQVSNDADEAGFRRGYALAGLALAGILVVEVIASVWFW
jgi:hypothetical protein